MKREALAALTAVLLASMLVIGYAGGVSNRQTLTATLVETSTTTATSLSMTTATSVSTHLVTTLSTLTTTATATTTVSNSTLPFVPCNVKVWSGYGQEPALEQVPVLLMAPNTTGYVCVTYQTAWQGNPEVFNSDSQMIQIFSVNGSVDLSVWFTPMIFRCSIVNGSRSCDQLLPRTFDITASPGSIQPTGSMNYVVVVYTVTALSNSTGFYDETAPWIGCMGMPMAVGYTASQVNASDFTLVGTQCPAEPFSPVAESAGGMGVTYVNLLP